MFKILKLENNNCFYPWKKENPRKPHQEPCFYVEESMWEFIEFREGKRHGVGI